MKVVLSAIIFTSLAVTGTVFSVNQAFKRQFVVIKHGALVQTEEAKLKQVAKKGSFKFTLDYKSEYSDLISVLTDETIEEVNEVKKEDTRQVKEKPVIIKKLVVENFRLETKELKVEVKKKTDRKYNNIAKIDIQSKIKARTVKVINDEIAYDIPFEFNSLGYAKRKLIAKNEEVKEDRISTALSASEKSNYKKKKIQTISKVTSTTTEENYVSSEPPKKEIKKVVVQNGSGKFDDKFLAFDYSKKEIKKEAKSKKPLLSFEEKDESSLDSLFNAVSFVAKKKEAKKVKKEKPPLSIEDIKKALSDSDVKKNEVLDPKKVNKEIKAKPPVDKVMASFAGNEKATYESEYSVSAISISKSKKVKKLHDYSLKFMDDVSERIEPDTNGYVSLSYKMNHSMMVRRAELSGKDHYITALDLTLYDDKPAIVPMFEYQNFDKILRKAGLENHGTHIVVELDDMTEEVELDHEHQDKMYLNSRFREIDPAESEYSYILFANVKAGNAVINFKTYKNEKTSKIIHLSKNTIYYDSNFYIESKKDDFKLFEEKVLGKTKSLLDIDQQNIFTLLSRNKIKKRSLNHYVVSRELYPVGTRTYYELSHLKEKIYLGRWESSFVDVPSANYMRHILNNFGEADTQRRCMVQLNLQKAPVELAVNGQTLDGTMGIDIKVLDNDGLFYQDLSHETKKIFIVGEGQGIVNIKIKYTDKSVDFLQSYCSNSEGSNSNLPSYVVEQL